MNVTKVKSVISKLVDGTMTSSEAYQILKSEGMPPATIGQVISLSGELDCAALLEMAGIEASEQVSKSTSKRKPASKSKPASEQASKSTSKLASKLASKKASKSEQASKPAKKVYSGELLDWQETEKAYLVADSGIDRIEVIGNEAGEPWGIKFGSSNVFTRIDRIETILSYASELSELVALLSK